MHEEYIPKQRGGFSLLREVYDWIESGLAAVICVVMIFTFVARTVVVVGQSMEPTLDGGDRLISTNVYSNLKSGDIVLITKPNQYNEPLIKRVIAVGGQTIDIDSSTGLVYVDGNRIYEPYIADTIDPERPIEIELPQVVPYGCVFVLGDNRNNSWDSRVPAVGMVDEKYILGKVIYRVMPYERFGRP